MVDVEGLGAGSRAFDLPEALLVAAGEGHATEPAAALRRRAGPPEFGICAGSAGQTMAGSFVRHNR